MRASSAAKLQLQERLYASIHGSTVIAVDTNIHKQTHIPCLSSPLFHPYIGSIPSISSYSYVFPRLTLTFFHQARSGARDATLQQKGGQAGAPYPMGILTRPLYRVQRDLKGNK